MTKKDKSLGKKIDEYFSNHPYLKDLYQEHPLEFDGAARYFYTEGMIEAYHKTKVNREKLVNRVSEWLISNIVLDLNGECELEWAVPFENQEEMITDFKKYMEDKQ